MRLSVLLIGAALLSSPLAAQQVLDGQFAAASYAPIPADAAFRVELLDDSDLNLRLQADLEQTLADLGYRVADDGYELLFVTNEITDISSYEDSKIFRFSIDTGDGLDPNTKQRGGTESRATIWSTTQDSLLARHGQVSPGEPLLRMEVEIRDVADRPRVVWLARAESATRRPDPYRLFQQMIPIVLEHLGTTVEEETIVLR